DLAINGTTRHTVISVPKNGFLYVLDAQTGKYLSGKNYTPVNWAKGLDANGRPIPDPAGRYWDKADGTAIILPSNIGAHGWEALAFSPKERLVYIPVEVMPTLMRLDKAADVGALSMDFYYGSKDPKWPAYGEIVAWDPVLQQARWRPREVTAVTGGLLHTDDMGSQG